MRTVRVLPRTIGACVRVCGGYVVLGSNGEFTLLTDEERVELVRHVRRLAAPDKLVIAGAGCECKTYLATV